MSGLVFRTPLIFAPPLERGLLRVRLARAERAIDGAFSRAASLQLDDVVLKYEQARRRKVHRWRAA
jgi:hypothetical protein